MSDQIANQTESKPRQPPYHLSHAVTSVETNIENHVPFAFKWPNFPGFVALILSPLQGNLLTSQY